MVREDDEVAGHRRRPAVRRAGGPGLVHRLRPGLRRRRCRWHRVARGGGRPRRRRGLHHARRDHRPYAGRLRARPRYGLRHPGAARRPARHPGHRHGPQPARPGLHPADPRPVRRRPRPSCARAPSSSRSARETYDLIVSNPPFVISPGARLTYRDGGMGGDDLCRTLVQQAGERLNDGGYAQFLANWQHVEGEEWQDRLRSWVPRGCDAWIVQREVQDITQYAELWLRDSGDHRTDPDAVRRAVRRLAGRVRGPQDQGGRLRLDHAAEVGASAPRPVDRDRGVAAPGGAAARRGRASPLRAPGLPARPTTTPRSSPTTSRWRRRWCRSRSGCPAPRTPSMWCCVRTAGMRRATKVDTVGAGFRGCVRRHTDRGPDPGRDRAADGRGPGDAARPHPAGDPAAGGGGLPAARRRGGRRGNSGGRGECGA